MEKNIIIDLTMDIAVDKQITEFFQEIMYKEGEEYVNQEKQRED